MPSMGSDSDPDRSVARRAFIAASFLVPKFRFGGKMGLPAMGRSMAKISFFAPLDLAIVGSTTLSVMRSKQGEISWNSKSNA
jgi:uncharacterized protein (DUF1501 family)